MLGDIFRDGFRDIFRHHDRKCRDISEDSRSCWMICWEILLGLSVTLQHIIRKHKRKPQKPL